MEEELRSTSTESERDLVATRNILPSVDSHEALGHLGCRSGTVRERTIVGAVLFEDVADFDQLARVEGLRRTWRGRRFQAGVVRVVGLHVGVTALVVSYKQHFRVGVPAESKLQTRPGT